MKQTAGFFLLRVPTLSIESLLQLLAQENLSSFIQETHVSDAIRLVSLTLSDHFAADPELKNDKLRQTALKYALRMGSRCTPFGLFAGCSLGEVTSASSLDLTCSQLVSHNWLDSQLIWEIGRQLINNPVIRPSIKFWPNTSLYKVGNQFRYTEVLTDNNPIEFFVSQIKSTWPIGQILKTACRGATLDQLTQPLIKRDYQKSQVCELIEKLITDQVLISELTPNVTGEDSLRLYIDKLSQIPGAEIWCAGLQQIKLLLQQSPISISNVKEIQDILVNQFGISVIDNSIVHCDSFVTKVDNHLNESVLDNLNQSFKKLFIINKLRPYYSKLDTFKQAFYERFEEREVPLMTALDGENGVGYTSESATSPSSLIQDILFLTKQTEKNKPLPIEVQKWLLKLYTKWVETGNNFLEITDQDLTDLGKSDVNLPDSYYALGYFLSASAHTIDAGQYRFVLKNLSGPSAFTLMGRFCRDDQYLANLVKAYFQEMQLNNPGCIYAEIAHSPSPRADNVIHRPHLRTYEIPFLAHSTQSLDQQIRLDDLMISIPQGKRIVLRSKKLGKEILPRLTSAHNFQNGLPLYRFLSDLQEQDNQLHIAWNWDLLGETRHLPRVQYKRVILQEARWRIHMTDWLPNISTQENVTKWRQSWQWPRFVAVVQADQELFLDLETVVCQKLLVDTLRRLNTLNIIEWLRTPDQCCVDGKDGKLTHEVILPFLNPEYKFFPTTVPSVTSSLKRTFAPGSEWLYLKIYSDIQTAQLVLDKLNKLIRRFIRGGRITHWFFIRYKDPQDHLRIRLHLNETSQTQEILQACRETLEPINASSAVYRLQIDTYEREIERYSPALIQWTEWIFWADSEASILISKLIIDESQRLTAAIMSIDRLLTDFSFSNLEKLVFYQQGFQVLLEEQENSTTLRKSLAIKYRESEKSIDRIISGKHLSPQEISWKQIGEQRSRHYASYIGMIQNHPERPPNYIDSLVHLSVNRLFNQHQRTYELIIYHHLAKAYKTWSILAFKED